MIGVVAVAAASGLPNVARALAEALPAAAFIGMGITLLRIGYVPEVAQDRTLRGSITSARRVRASVRRRDGIR